VSPTSTWSDAGGISGIGPAAEPDGVFCNPVIPGFHPDPSICRVGDDFYLVTSSFEYFPGLPIFTSRDLVSWRQIGHCLTRQSQLDLRTAPPSGGLYAATIRWHDGHFFVTGTNVSGGGHFIVHATDPAGPWSDPVWVDQNGIDPSLFFDGDTAYFTSTVEPDPAGPHVAEPAFVRGVQQSVVDPFTGQRLTDVRFLWGGTGGKFPEGPHLYRRGSYHYLLLAEGGTEYGHMVTTARATSPWGPWEPCPHNPILTHRSTASPIQAVGHGDLVELADGSWWMVCLGVRPSAGWPMHHLGRETFLTPVEWTDDGWPHLPGSGLVEPSLPRPPLAPEPLPASPTRDDFDTAFLGPHWNCLRVPLAQHGSLSRRPGWLTLCCQAGTLDDPLVAFVARRQEHLTCTARALLDFVPRGADEAGLTVRMNEHHHYELAVRRADDGRQAVLRRRIGGLSALAATVPIQDGAVELGVDADPTTYRFFVRQSDGRVDEVGTGETRYLSSECAGGFTGVYLGMYATGNGLDSSGAAHWDWFDYRS